MNIRTYLTQVAAQITESSLREIKTLQDWQRVASERRSIYLDRMGLTPHLEAKRTPLNIQVTGTVQREGYRIEKLYYESLPKLYVTANLYLPDGLTQPAPAIVYFCGHSPQQKVHYQAHARRFCQLGFITLIVDTLQHGEVKGEHHGCYGLGRFQWYSRGYSPAGVERWNGIRAVDLLSDRPDVDAKRIGITGISGGGGMSWWLGAADERVAAVAASCGTGTLRSHLSESTVDVHCDCMFHLNNDGWDLADIGALIAPRPLMVSSAEGDIYYQINSVRETVDKISKLYQFMNASPQLSLVTYPGPHSYTPYSRQHIFAWFLKHLMGKDISPAEIQDLNPEADEPADHLRVFTGPLPEQSRNSSIDQDFIPAPTLKPILNATTLKERKSLVVARLKELSFRHFQKSVPDPDIKILQQLDFGHKIGFRFSYAGEADYRHTSTLLWNKTLNSPTQLILSLRSPGENSGESEKFIQDMEKHAAICHLTTRGSGDLSWGPELNWHVRRGAAITGRTVASMRVYDTLRALAAIRSLKEIHSSRILIAAHGEMAPVALYTALLDGQISGVILSDPPATQNISSAQNGRGAAIEMLSCLRVTDLPEVAALLWPAELTFVGACAESYDLTKQSYLNLGSPEKFRTFGLAQQE